MNGVTMLAGALFAALLILLWTIYGKMCGSAKVGSLIGSVIVLAVIGIAAIASLVVRALA